MLFFFFFFLNKRNPIYENIFEINSVLPGISKMCSQAGHSQLKFFLNKTVRSTKLRVEMSVKQEKMLSLTAEAIISFFMA